MNSADIRNLLKPMIDFSPALLRAGEIVDAAEMAEKRLPAIEKEIVALNAQLEDLALRKVKYEAAALKARNESMAEIDHIKKDEDALRATLHPIREQRDALLASMDIIKAQKGDEIKALDKTIATLKAERDSIAGEIKALKNKFAA